MRTYMVRLTGGGGSAVTQAGSDDAMGRAAGAADVGTQNEDAWVRRARPMFLYVMYALLLWAIPMGLIAAVRPAAATAMAAGIAAYLRAIPEPLYALFGTGYLGYTVAREWGKGR